MGVSCLQQHLTTVSEPDLAGDICWWSLGTASLLEPHTGHEHVGPTEREGLRLLCRPVEWSHEQRRGSRTDSSW